MIAVHGDSTALATRDGLAKMFKLAPRLDRRRWHSGLSARLASHPVIRNTGVNSSSIIQVIDRMRVSGDLRCPTILFDRMNDEENADDYLAELERAVALIESDDWLIVPQVPKAAGQENPALLAHMMRINEGVRERWPAHTFSREATDAFIAALSPADTRYDGLHRNTRGQRIEAAFISAWIKRKGWSVSRADADRRQAACA